MIGKIVVTKRLIKAPPGVPDAAAAVCAKAWFILDFLIDRNYGDPTFPLFFTQGAETELRHFILVSEKKLHFVPKGQKPVVLVF